MLKHTTEKLKAEKQKLELKDTEEKSRFVQLQNPKTKNWLRIDTLKGLIISHRKKPYKCVKC